MTEINGLRRRSICKIYNGSSTFCEATRRFDDGIMTTPLSFVGANSTSDGILSARAAL